MQMEVLTSEQEYRDVVAINYSSLSALAVSPKYYKKQQESEDTDTDAFIKGGAVDCLLTASDEFDSRYYVMTAKKPESEMMLAYVNNYLDTEDHNQALVASGYKRALSSDKWESDGKPYWEALKASKSKKILDFETYTQVQAVVKSLKESKYTKKYFQVSNDDCEILYQVPIFWNYRSDDIKCKSLLDIIVVDHKEKTISPVDIKTTSSSVYSFASSFRKFKYYLQAAFYTNAVLSWKLRKGYDQYSVLPFKFLVAEMSNFNLPIVYTVSEKDLEIGFNGGYDKFGNKIKGWTELLNDFLVCQQADLWEYPVEVMQNNGEIELNVF